MFRTVPLFIIGSFSTVHTAMVYVIQVCWQLASRIRTEPVWHIPLLCVLWKTPDDGQRNCPKHAEFYPKNKFEKLVHLLVAFIIRIKIRCLQTSNCIRLVKWNTNLMQHCAGFISAESLYMFRAQAPIIRSI